MERPSRWVFACLLFTAASANAHTVYFDAASTSTSVGSSFSLDISGKSFFTKTDKGGVGFTFDPNVVQVESVAVNSGTWEIDTPGASVDNTAGSVTGLNVASATGHGPDFDLAKVLFKAVGIGNTGLTLSENSTNRFVGAGTTNVIPGFRTENGSVTVTAGVAPVPLPGAIWLLGTALASLVLGRRAVA